MDQCGGALLVHLDSTMAACTEELEGRCCAGPDAAHRGGIVSCQDVLGLGGCETCAFEQFTEGNWRHVVHVGTMVRARSRCRAHRQALRAPVYEPNFEELLAQIERDGQAVRHRLPR